MALKPAMAEADGEAQAAERRLRWHCRRGMLELDLLLQGFLENGLQALSEQERRDFERLLEAPDPELLDWLMGHSAPREQDLADVVERIRAHVMP